MNRDLTKGPVVRSMLLFAIPMILGDLLQQCYNIADTLIVGRVLGRDALAAVGSSFTLMTFLTSILLGLCMGSGALFSMRFGQRDEQALRVLPVYRARDGGADRFGVCLSGRASRVPARARGRMGRHAGVPVCDLHGDSRRLPVQLFRFVFKATPHK